MSDYEYMDSWGDEDVAKFKEKGADLQEPSGTQVAWAQFFARPQIVAEGDSWFDFLPRADLIDCLRVHHGYRIKNYAKAGDTLENMVYGTGRRGFSPVAPTIATVLAKIEEIRPAVFLFSGGGNDIMGDEFAAYLNHVESGLPDLRGDYFEYVIGVVFRRCIEDLIARIAAVSPDTHIIMHGYGYALPTGKGVTLIGFNFAGPWMLPALVQKRILDAERQRKIVRDMVDAYNEMLRSLDESHSNFHYVNLRPLIDPEKDWGDELHLTSSAYARSADVMHEVIQKIISPNEWQLR